MLVTKPCTRCGGSRSRRTYKQGAKKGKQYWYCTPCAVSRMRKWKEDNPERYVGHKTVHAANMRARTKTDPQWAKERQLKKMYRMSLDDFDRLLAEQGGVCAVCRTDTPGGAGTWQVDHDHACCSGRTSCGKCVRGLLCFSCNQALGLVRDSREILQSLDSYLEKFEGD